MRRRTFLQNLAGVATLATWPGYVPAKSRNDVVYLRPGDTDYLHYTIAFNKRIVRRPEVIAVCTNEDGIQHAIEYARELGLAIAVKSGGHSFEGFSLNDGGLVIDLTPMHGHELNDDGRYIAQPACRLIQTYEYLVPRGRLVPVGSCGMVGIAGLTLGGGYGLFSRRHGLACDALVRLRLIDGQGKAHEVGPGSELFWACCGGGNGHYGVVTQLQFESAPAPPQLWRHLFKAGDLTPARVTEIAEAWFETAITLPHEAFSAFVLNHKSLTILITNTQEDSPTHIQSSTKRLEKVMDKKLPDLKENMMVGVRRYYGKLSPLNFKNASAGYYRGYRDIKSVAPAIFERVLKTPELLYQINTLGGAINNPMLANRAVYPHRAYEFLGEIQSYWGAPIHEERAIKGVDEVQRLLKGAGVHAHYGNYPDIKFNDWANAYYGESGYTRLQAIKKLHDPGNLFRYAQSVRAASNTGTEYKTSREA